jgi:hypothetical protein
MDATAQMLAALGIVLGTVDYALLVRRRAGDRRRQRLAEATGLLGLVRVMLAEDPVPGAS